MPALRRPGAGSLARDRGRARCARRHALGVAAGVQRPSRTAVRLLHAGDADDGTGVPALESGRRHRRGDPGCDQRRHLPLHRVPADRRLDPRSGAGGGRREHHAGSKRRKGRARHEGPGRIASLARQERQPGRGSAVPPRPGALHRRHQAPRHGARRDRAQPIRPCSHRRHRHRGGETAAGRDRGRDGQGRGRAGCTAAVVRGGPDRAGHDRDREGTPLRRDGRSGDRREPLHRRGRVRPDRGRVRAAAGRARPDQGSGGRCAARARSTRHEHGVRPHVLVRRGRPGVRGRAAEGRGDTALAALDRYADGYQRRHRRLRPGHGRGHDLRELDELHVLPVADSRLAEDSGEQAQPRSGGGGWQLRLEVLHAQGSDLRGLPVDGGRPSREVRRGQGHPHRQQRPLRLRSPLRGGARIRRRRHAAGPPDRLRRRLRRVPPVRDGHARERAVPDRRPVPDPARRVLARRRADEQESTGRLPRLRGGGVELGARAARRHGGAPARPRSRRDPTAQPDRPGRVPVQDADGEHLRQRQLPGRAGEVLELSDYDHWVAERDRARAEGRHVGIGVVASQERSVFSSTEFWFWFDDPQFTPTSSPESASVQIDPTGQIVVTLHSQSLWGNSPETVVSDGRGRGVRRRSVVDRGHLCRLPACPAGDGPGRLALHRDGVGRGGRGGDGAEGEDSPHRVGQARGGGVGSRVPRRRRGGDRRSRRSTCRSARSR